MTVWSLVRRGVRWALRSWWSSARPSAGLDLRGEVHGDAVAALQDGRVPEPDDRFQPTTTPVGAWSAVDPALAPAWPRRAGLAGTAVWAGLVAWTLRRTGVLGGGADGEGAPSGPEAAP